MPLLGIILLPPFRHLHLNYLSRELLAWVGQMRQNCLQMILQIAQFGPEHAPNKSPDTDSPAMSPSAQSTNFLDVLIGRIYSSKPFRGRTLRNVGIFCSFHNRTFRISLTISHLEIHLVFSRNLLQLWLVVFLSSGHQGSLLDATLHEHPFY